jgi:hypothetical protein
VTLGDVNGDGRLDIVTANNNSANASVLLGNGDGTFAAQATFATGGNPRSVTVGDVNGDGNLDIITANFGGDSVSVLLGNGNGTFQTQATFATNRPYSVTLGDVNGDGRLDITTASYSSDTARVLLGNGNGTFQTQAIFAAGDGPLAAALGDLNGDGRLDIATANFNAGSTSVLLNSIAFTGQTAAVVNAANTPTFGTPTATDDGFTVQISNYDANFTYGGTATAGGTVAISNTGLVTVSGVAANTSSTATITTTRVGYANGSAQVTANRPTINSAATLSGGKAGTPYVMTYATLRAALNVANGVSIVIQSVQSGRVQKWNGTKWVTVSTAANAPLTQRSVSAGDTIRWLPPAGVSGNRPAFRANALNGSLYSAVTAQVTINLARPTWFRK